MPLRDNASIYRMNLGRKHNSNPQKQTSVSCRVAINCWERDVSSVYKEKTVFHRTQWIIVVT